MAFHSAVRIVDFSGNLVSYVSNDSGTGSASPSLDPPVSIFL